MKATHGQLVFSNWTCYICVDARLRHKILHYMMSNKRRVDDREFKLRAVRLSMESSDLSRLATELGITSKILYKWRTALGNVESKQFPGHGNKAMTPEEAELAKVKKQLAEAEMELEILKKAIGIFSRKGGSSTSSF